MTVQPGVSSLAPGRQGAEAAGVFASWARDTYKSALGPGHWAQKAPRKPAPVEAWGRNTQAGRSSWGAKPRQPCPDGGSWCCREGFFSGRQERTHSWWARGMRPLALQHTSQAIEGDPISSGKPGRAGQQAPSSRKPQGLHHWSFSSQPHSCPPPAPGVSFLQTFPKHACSQEESKAAQLAQGRRPVYFHTSWCQLSARIRFQLRPGVVCVSLCVEG